MTTGVPAQPGLADWQRLVAGVLAAYWAPLQTMPDGTAIPGADLADETDFGQADHVLAQLLAAGVHLPGVTTDELDWLSSLDLRPDQPESCDDPALSLTLVLPRSVIKRLQQAVSDGHSPTLAALTRAMILVGLDCLPSNPTAPHDITSDTAKEDPLTPPGRKPRQPRRSVAQPVARPLHPLRSYSAYDTLRDLVAAERQAHDDSPRDIDTLTTLARATINTALAPHALRLTDADTFLTGADYDEDSDFQIGAALASLDVDALAREHLVAAGA